MQISRPLHVAAIAVLACLAFGCNASTFVSQPSKPVVVLQAPANGSQVAEGGMIDVQSVASDPVGVAAVDLIVDGMTVRTDPVPNKSGEKLVAMTQKWKATAGTHSVGARAVNTAGVPSEPVTAMIFVVVATPPAAGSVPAGPPPTEPAPSAAETSEPSAAATETGTAESPAQSSSPKETLAATGTPERVLNLTGRVAFVSNRDGTLGIYTMNADGSGVQQLTTGAADAEPDWSPDGSRIAFSSDRDGNHEIYVMNADGSALTRLTDNPAFDDQPAWSPDGARIAFESDRDTEHGIFIMNADGTNPIALPNTVAGDKFPAWSPEGAKIAFVSGRDGNDEIYTVNADGSDPTRLTDSAEDDWRPAWSPDGRLIAFDSRRDGTGGVYLMHPDGTGQLRFTPGDGGYGEPAWSPDGAYIAYDVQNPGGRSQICIVSILTNGRDCITNQTEMDGYPAWQPGGSASSSAAPTQAGPTATTTPQAPAGVYVVDVHTDPAQPKQKENVAFRVTFFNNIGQDAIMKWYVKIYEPDKKQSFGETTKIESRIPGGTSDIPSEATWKPGGGVPCKDYIARVFWTDAKGIYEYPKPGGDTFQYYFTVCP